MKIKSILLISFFLSFNFLSAQDATVTEIIGKINQDSLVLAARNLSGDASYMVGETSVTILSRYASHTGNELAGAYIWNKFNYFGLNPQYETFDGFAGVGKGKNVIGTKIGTNGDTNKFYIVCAHYDVAMPATPVPEGGIIPGFDDNASGTAAVIELARVFSTYSFTYTIKFIAFDEEEVGACLLGSNYYATQAKARNDDILGVLNLDMIAYEVRTIDDWRMCVETDTKYKTPEFGEKYRTNLVTYGIGIYGIQDANSGASDHQAFINQGYRAVLIIETPLNSFYHKTSDVYANFNMAFFTKMTKGTAATLASYALNVDPPLPVELISFKAYNEKNNVHLKWTTATETNNYGFEIERGINSKENVVSSKWEKIGFVRGSGNSNSPKDYSYIDNTALYGYYEYRLKQIDMDGTTAYSNISKIRIGNVPMQVELHDNYPNPFNPNTVISYQSPVNSKLTLKIYDVLGREIETLVNEPQPAGKYSVEWNASKYSSGIYYYELRAGDFRAIKKMMFVK